MGLWSNQVLPRAIAWGMKGETFQVERGKALAGVTGRVLELGFGAGLNLPHYPEDVTELLALEPAELNRKLAAKRISAAPFPVSWVGLRGEEIPLDDASIDVVTSTWTMCTIPELEKALAEVRRVLRPRGELHFLEHGLSPVTKVARWQNRMNRFQMFWAGGCRLNRKIDADLERAGFALDGLKNFQIEGPKIATYMYRGVARPS